MTLWMIRAGKHGEYEPRFVDDSRVYLTWEELSVDVSTMPDRKSVVDLLVQMAPEAPPTRHTVHAGEIWTFAHAMQPGDWFIVPSKLKPVIHIGEITGPYEYHPENEPSYRHFRAVRWLQLGVPRSAFDKDLLYSFGSTLTICRIARNDAERRVKAMQANQWRSSGSIPVVWSSSEEDEAAAVDLERLARDQISKMILQKFKGHGLARLVDAVLKAQGYFTYRSPEGADKGVDLLAAPGSLGFGRPRVCVQVKSQESPVDRPTLDQLIGAMQNFHAEQGLLVAWGGFKQSVDKEVASQFFRVRLWDQDSLIDQLFENYDKLDDDIRAELPLKRVWIAVTDDENG